MDLPPDVGLVRQQVPALKAGFEREEHGCSGNHKGPSDYKEDQRPQPHVPAQRCHALPQAVDLLGIVG